MIICCWSGSGKEVNAFDDDFHSYGAPRDSTTKNIIARANDGECEESVSTRLSHIFFVSRSQLRQPKSS